MISKIIEVQVKRYLTYVNVNIEIRTFISKKYEIDVAKTLIVWP